MRRRTFIRLFIALFLLSGAGRDAWALGEEDFGNAPLNGENFKEWPNILPTVNHSSRVYHRWVNGNEAFYYQGDVQGLNDTVRTFAAGESPGKEVVLRPGPGKTESFDRSRQIAFGWMLQLRGGISKEILTLDKGDRVWNAHPRLTIYVSRELKLADLKIPAGLTILTLPDLTQRVREGAKSTNMTVRGLTADELAALDPYDAASREAIAGLLRDSKSWVQLNAVAALALFGKLALSDLPQIRMLQQVEDAQLKAQAAKSIEAIEKSEDRTAAEREHRATLDLIRSYVTNKSRKNRL